MKIQGQYAVVTGGAMGIGLCTCKRLLAEGCGVAVWDYSQPALDQARSELEQWRLALGDDTPGILYCCCDVTDPASVEAAAQESIQAFGRVDILINNAGTVVPGYLHENDLKAQQRVIDVNLSALAMTIRTFLPGMYERNCGCIVNISSAAGTLGVPGQGVYSATKWAVWGLTESLRHEVCNLKRRVHCASVHPGYLSTGLFEGARMRGLGGWIVPRVKSHDVIARAVVEYAVRRRRNVVYRPRSVRLAVLLRGILPDRVFFRMIRLLQVHTSMDSFRGRAHG